MIRKIIFYSIEFFISKRMHIAVLAYLNTIYFMRFIPEMVSSYNPLVPLVSFFITWSAYLENLTTDKKEDMLNTQIKASFYPIEKFYPLFYLATLIIAWLVNIRCFFLALFTLFICLSYTHRWLPIGGNVKKKLKEFYIIKNIIPPLAWVFPTLIIPFVASGIKFIPEYSFLIVIGILLSLREEIKFDIPDTEGDRATGIKTLPNTIGELATKRILRVINYSAVSLFFIMLFLLYQSHLMIRFQYLLMNSVPLIAAFIYDQGFTNSLLRERKKEYCNAGILWWTVLLSAYLILSFPYNIFVFIFLKLTGNFYAKIFFRWYNRSKVQGSL